MLKLETLKQCLWRNVHAPEPVLAGTIAFGDSWSWTTKRLPRAVLAVLEERLPGTMPSTGFLDAPQLVAHLAQRIQLLADVAAPACGVASRDQGERRAVVFFSCLDVSLAVHSLSLAVQIVDRLTRSHTGPEALAKMLERCAEMVEKAGLEPATRDIVLTAMRRGIPWIRVSPLARQVQLGHGYRQHRVAGTICSGEGDLARDQLLHTVYPEGDDGRIPTAMVTGTTGKTSTSTMLASILSSAGHVVGCATTEGVRIDTELVKRGDLASADGASIVLRDPTVTAAVLETARGGIVKTGLYVDRCDVAALLNVQRDQIGMDGIETLDDMVALKRKVLDVARKAVVLNADDPRCLALAPEFSSSLRTILFSRSAESPAIRNQLASGGDALFLANKDGRETIIVASGSEEVPLLATADVPATKGGLIWFHGTNAMATAALAIGLGIELDAIRAGLRRYGREYAAATLRMVFAEGFPMRVMFDSSGKAPAYAAAVTVTDAIDVAGKRICVITVPGNRPDWAFAESAAALAGHFDRYICFEREEYRRGRKPGEIAARLADALIAAGVEPGAVAVTGGHKDAARFLAGEATERDLVMIFGTNSMATVEDYRAALRGMRGHT